MQNDTKEVDLIELEFKIEIQAIFELKKTTLHCWKRKLICKIFILILFEIIRRANKKLLKILENSAMAKKNN